MWRRGQSSASGPWLGACPRHGGLVCRERARCPVVVRGEQGSGLLVRERVRRSAGRVPAARDQRHGSRAGPEQRLSRRVESGGVPRSRRRVQAARRGRGATPPSLGLLPLAPVDGARLRRGRRQAVRDPDGRRTLWPGRALPRVRARRPLRRERRDGDIRSGAGLCGSRVVPARAAAVLVRPALGLGARHCGAPTRARRLSSRSNVHERNRRQGRLSCRPDRRRSGCGAGAVRPVRIRRSARSRDAAIQARATRPAAQRRRLRGVVVVRGTRPHDTWLGEELLARRPQPGRQPARPAETRRRLREQGRLHLHRPRSRDRRRARLRVHLSRRRRAARCACAFVGEGEPARARPAAVAGSNGLARGRVAVRACVLRRPRPTMKLTTITNVSVDGVMQGLGGPDEDRRGGFERGGWALPLFDDEAATFVYEVYQRADAFLLGRRTYEIFAGYWGTMAGSGHLIAAALNTRPKYVASTTLTDPHWPDTTVLSGDVAAAVGELKAKPGGELQVHGSGELIRRLLDDNLVDEIILLTYPVVVGQGTRLFPATGPDAALELIDSRATAGGVTLQVYRPTGRPQYETATT